MVSDPFPYPFSMRLVLFSAAAAGCLATLTQVILFRELMVILQGNELALALLLAWWLSGIAAGALLPQWRPAERDAAHSLPLALFGFPMLMLMCSTLARLSPGLLSLPVEENPSPLQIGLLSGIVVFPPGLFTGFMFPLLAVALKHSRGGFPANPEESEALMAGRVFLWESLGSVGAGLLLTTGVIPRWTPPEIAWMAGSILAVTIISLADPRIRQACVTLGILLVLIAGWFARWPEALDRWSAASRWQARHPGYELIQAKETPYQRLEIGLREEQYTLFGNGSPLFSFPDEYGMTYWGAMCVSQHPRARRILLVGGGGPDLYRIFSQQLPETFHVLEISADLPAIVRAAAPTEEPVENAPQPEFILEDARRFWNSTRDAPQYDLIAVNQPDPLNGLINRFYTQEFFEQARRCMPDDGVLVITAPGTPNYERGDTGVYCGTLYWTLREVFAEVLVVPGTTWWFFASPARRLVSDPDTIVQAFQGRKASTPSFPPEIYYSYYEPDRIQRAVEAMEAYRDLPRNRDGWPLCYLYNLIAWSKQHGYFKWLPVARVIHTGIPLAGFCVLIMFGMYAAGFVLLRLGLPRGGRAAFPALLVLFVAGLASMGAELCVLLYFQSRVGYLYVHAGLFFGVYMAGLAAGAAWILRRGPRGTEAGRMRMPGAALQFAGLLVLTPAWLALTRFPGIPLPLVEGLLLGWLAVLAGITGVIFTLVSGEARRAGLDLVSAAGWADAGDCAGGAVGALLTGVMLAPMAGLVNTLFLLGGLVGLSGLTQAWLSRK
ncbi:MAG: hypothetical protein ACE15F_20860 [bacterium]